MLVSTLQPVWQPLLLHRHPCKNISLHLSFTNVLNVKVLDVVAIKYNKGVDKKPQMPYSSVQIKSKKEQSLRNTVSSSFL